MGQRARELKHDPDCRNAVAECNKIACLSRFSTISYWDSAYASEMLGIMTTISEWAINAGNEPIVIATPASMPY